jgi:hypothetical protein
MSANKIGINDGTERLRGFLKPNPLTGDPKIVWSPSCKGVLSEFGAVPSPMDGQTRAYRWKVDREGNIVGQTPDDKNNHGVKADIYGIVERYGFGYVVDREVIKVRKW